MSVETELKFRLPPRSHETIASLQIPGTTIGARSESNLVSTYFDTTKHKLKRHGFSLRVRRAGSKHVQTIKASVAANIGRGEWETDVKKNAPDLAKIGGTPLKRLASKKLGRKLKPIFQVSVHRVVVPVHTRGSEIEFAIDQGRVVAGNRSSRIEEIELELKSGQLADLFRIAKIVEQRYQAELYLRSKSEQGYDLLQGKREQTAFAEPVELNRDMLAKEAFGMIARSCVRHFAGNADAVRRGDPEGIHQMRVGLRRLRATIAVFSKILPHAGTDKIKAELKWLTSELAAARDLDVFVGEEIRPAAQDLMPRRAGKAIEDEFTAKRDQAFERAKKALASERFRLLLLNVHEWIELAQRNDPDDDANQPIVKFARELLHRRVRKIDKQGRQLAKLSARQRHKLRIGVKKIRYAVDFFESLFPKSRQRALSRLSRHLKKIQDSLGSLNDFVSHRKMAADAALKGPPRHRRGRAFALGVVVGREDEAAKALMEVAIKEVGKLRLQPYF
jgi:inorganic triphosphatase YgiF